MKNQKTILLPINQGFAFRYFIQTDIFRKLQESGHRIILLVPDPEDSFFEELRQLESVHLAPYHMEQCHEYIKKSPLEPWLKRLRLFIQNGHYDIQTTEDLYRAYLKDNKNQLSPSSVKYLSINFLVSIGRKYAFIRQLILWAEHTFFSPPLHRDIFDAYTPDLLLVSSLGTFDYDQLLMREARSRNIPAVSVVLSWDNTTTRGMAGAIPDHVIAWTDAMKEELVNQNDIPHKKIFVGGVAHFDHYYKEETFLPKHELFEKLGLDLEKKLLFFVTKSPNGYAWNADIAEIILRALHDGTIDLPCQLLVRLHPIYYRRTNGSFTFQSFLDQFYALDEQYADLALNEPSIQSENLNYSMPEGEIRLLASILKYSDVMINMFSTLNLEASIFDIPIVNVCFEGTSYTGPKKARYDISLDERQTHNQRVVKTGGVMMARNEIQLIDCIRESLDDPDTGKEGRELIRKQETGPYHGNAGDTIARHILKLLESQNH